MQYCWFKWNLIKWKFFFIFYFKVLKKENTGFGGFFEIWKNNKVITLNNCA